MSERGPEIRPQDKFHAKLMEKVSKLKGAGRLLTPVEWHATDTHADTVAWHSAEGQPRGLLRVPLLNQVRPLYIRAMVLKADGDEIARLSEEHGADVAGAIRVGPTAVAAAFFSPIEESRPEASFRIGPKDLYATLGVYNPDENIFVGAQNVEMSGIDIAVGDLPVLYPRAANL